MKLTTTARHRWRASHREETRGRQEISVARFNSRFSRSQLLDPSLVNRRRGRACGPRPRRAACTTPATCPGHHTHPRGNPLRRRVQRQLRFLLPGLLTRRTARSRNSSGYFLGAGIRPPFVESRPPSTPGRFTVTPTIDVARSQHAFGLQAIRRRGSQSSRMRRQWRRREASVRPSPTTLCPLLIVAQGGVCTGSARLSAAGSPLRPRPFQYFGGRSETLAEYLRGVAHKARDAIEAAAARLRSQSRTVAGGLLGEGIRAPRAEASLARTVAPRVP